MRVALLSESPADETALRVLIKAVLGRVSFAPTGFRARGWPNVAQVLPSVIRHLHFNTDTEVLAASIRHPIHIVEAARMGADVVTVPPAVIEQCFKHPLTDIGLERFLKDWEKAQAGKASV